MARKPSKPTRPGEPSLMDRLTAITNTTGDGTLSAPQFAKVLGLYTDGVRAGEAMLWSDIGKGIAGLPTDAPTALLMLAIYAKLAMEATSDYIPEKTDTSPEEVVPLMQMLVTLPGWEPSARWPFSKAEMAKDLHRLGPYLIDGMEKVSEAAQIIKKMN